MISQDVFLDFITPSRSKSQVLLQVAARSRGTDSRTYILPMVPLNIFAHCVAYLGRLNFVPLLGVTDSSNLSEKRNRGAGE